MLKKIGKYIVEKITKNVVSRGIKYGFYTALIVSPGTMLSALGVYGIGMTAIIVHSGIVESVSYTVVEKTAQVIL